MQQLAEQADADQKKRQISISAARSNTASSMLNISCTGTLM
jgi:hypothetical protein